MSYLVVLKLGSSIYDNNLEKANWAFTVLIAKHKKRCKMDKKDYPFSAGFYDSPDENLFVWGIGLFNLCRYYGLNIIIDDYLIPKELVIPVSNRF